MLEKHYSSIFETRY